FSSRRRHTRFSRDWSSDVCSSDLVVGGDSTRAGDRGRATSITFPSWNRSRLSWFVRRISLPTWILPLGYIYMDLEVTGLDHLAEIGRASCREVGELCDGTEGVKMN